MMISLKKAEEAGRVECKDLMNKLTEIGIKEVSH
jgi:hypothetical protein